jgi:hypothetical protein
VSLIALIGSVNGGDLAPRGGRHTPSNRLDALPAVMKQRAERRGDH